MFTDRSRTFAGLLLCLTCAEMICEGKTYSKKLIEMDRLGDDDQVFVRRSDKDEMVAQYFCDKSNCTVHICDKCFENQSGYLVLILHNISHSDRFDAFRNGEKTPFLPNFTLDEDVPSTTTAVPDETPTPSINPTDDVPSASTTTAVPDETTTTSIKPTEPPHTTKMPETTPGEALPTEAKVIIGILGAVVLAEVIPVIAVIAYEVYARRTGQDGIIARVARKFCGHKQVKEVKNPTELKALMSNNGVKRSSKSMTSDIL